MGIIRLTLGFRLVLPVLLVLAAATAAGCGRISEPQSELSTRHVVKTRVGAFNLLRLGESDKNLDRMVDLIESVNFHLFAALEIMTEESAHELHNHLVDRTGRDWRMILSTHASGESSYREYKAFFYRHEYVRPEDLDDDKFCETSEGVFQVSSACFARDRGSASGPRFDRDPFVGHFRISGEPITLIGVHLIWGGGDVEGVERRKRELGFLRKTMDKVREKTPGATVITAGDFNLAIDEGRNDAVIPPDFYTSGDYEVAALIDEGTTTGNSNYDHLVYYPDSQHYYIEGSAEVVKDFRNSRRARSLFRREVSDHYPVVAAFRLHE